MFPDAGGLHWSQRPEGIASDQEKVQKTTDCLAPRVRSALALYNYCQTPISHFSEITKPPIRRTEKDRPFSLGKEQQVAFDQLKYLLGQVPVISPP